MPRGGSAGLEIRMFPGPPPRGTQLAPFGSSVGRGGGRGSDRDSEVPPASARTGSHCGDTDVRLAAMLVHMAQGPAPPARPGCSAAGPVPSELLPSWGAKDSPSPPGGTGAAQALLPGLWPGVERVPWPVGGGCTLCLQGSEHPPREGLPWMRPRPGPGGSRGSVPSVKPSRLL